MAIEFDALDPETGGPIRLRVASGVAYGGVCRDCGQGNGVWIDAPENPLPARPPFRCPECKGGNLEWERLGII